ncbi:MAGUK 55 kDa erythrocyte membrane protein [Sarotherodon galilaeus]
MTHRPRPNNMQPAGTWYHHGRPNFPPRVRHNLKQDNAGLRAQLEETQWQLHMCKSSLREANTKALYFESQVDEYRRKFYYLDIETEKTINDLKKQLDQALSNETKSSLQDIHTLKFELREAKVERINNANRLILADKIMHKLTSNLGDANKKLQQQNRNSIDTQTTISDAPSKNQCCGMQQTCIDQLQQQLQNAKEELKKQAEEHEDEKEALRSEIKQLKGLKEQNEEKLMNLEKELNDTKASYIELLEEQKKENANITQALQKAEEEKASLLKTLKEQEDMEKRLEELTSIINELEQESEERKRSCWPFRFFS